MKILNSITSIVVGMLVLCLSSCSSDDNSNNQEVTILQKWNQTKMITKVGNISSTENYEDNVEGCEKNYIEFSEEDIFLDVVFFKQQGVCTENVVQATWKKTGNTLVINDSGLLTGTYEIIKLTNTELQIKSTIPSPSNTVETTIYYKKAQN